MALHGFAERQDGGAGAGAGLGLPHDASGGQRHLLPVLRTCPGVRRADPPASRRQGVFGCRAAAESVKKNKEAVLFTTSAATRPFHGHPAALSRCICAPVTLHWPARRGASLGSFADPRCFWSWVFADPGFRTPPANKKKKVYYQFFCGFCTPACGLRSAVVSAAQHHPVSTNALSENRRTSPPRSHFARLSSTWRYRLWGGSSAVRCPRRRICTRGP